jgi:dihydroorotate dehydrogenase (NAD+) catalytic subunit
VVSQQEAIRNPQSAIRNPFYDPLLSYQENYDSGPFGPIAEQPSPEVSAALVLPETEWVTVVGLRLRRPVGIPSGPLLNSKFTGAAFRWGFDLCHYKTVRSREWPSHPAPNVLYVDAPRPIPPADMGRAPLTARPFRADEPVDIRALSITNSFGMPAQSPAVWQADMERAALNAGPGQALVASVTGTARLGSTHTDFVADHARAAAMCAETGAHAIEVNLSCPNLGGHSLLCHDIQATSDVCRAVREAIGDRPLFAKIGSYSPDDAGEAGLRAIVEATTPYVQGYGAVNAVPVPVMAGDGGQALPGTGRQVAGVCGAALRAVGLDIVSRLARIRAEHGYDYAIIGVGGFLTPDDYFAYIEAGADAVQGATGPMWDHLLAVRVATYA